MTLEDRVCLVTGGGRGIGRAIARRMAAAGAKVAITARSEDELERVRAEVDVAGDHFLCIADDLTRREAPARIVDRVESAWGPVEVLVNNAGVGSSQNPKPLVDFDDEFWDFTMTLNVRAPYLLTKRVLPAMLSAGWGRIINIASINSKIPSLHAAAYISSKHAVAGLTKATAIEVAGRGITANALCPGVVATRMNDKRLEYDAQRLQVPFAELESKASPLGRRLVPEEIAGLVLFLVSDDALAINGQLINVCGGQVMM
jgi:NAD(P)-dependent dehydrogenase (short-subunit alcohol dehydrogenase family)